MNGKCWISESNCCCHLPDWCCSCLWLCLRDLRWGCCYRCRLLADLSPLAVCGVPSLFLSPTRVSLFWFVLNHISEIYAGCNFFDSFLPLCFLFSIGNWFGLGHTICSCIEVLSVFVPLRPSSKTGGFPKMPNSRQGKILMLRGWVCFVVISWTAVYLLEDEQYIAMPFVSHQLNTEVSVWDIARPCCRTPTSWSKTWVSPLVSVWAALIGWPCMVARLDPDVRRHLVAFGTFADKSHK